MIRWLDPQSFEFPPVSQALTEPNGLLAAGGDLCSRRLLVAYRDGIFPWFEDGQPILWWSPEPRAVLFADRLHLGRSLRKTQRRGTFRFSVDASFEQVILACSEDRHGQAGTWISGQMIDAYVNLHRLGHAHSVECWCEDELVGGLYGVAIGRMFFGESMFSHQPNASKLALAYLVQGLRCWDFPVIDCQQESAHLTSLGAETITRTCFQAIVSRESARPGFARSWQSIWPVDERGERHE